jgi:hypothetical protein
LQIYWINYVYDTDQATKFICSDEGWLACLLTHGKIQSNLWDFRWPPERFAGMELPISNTAEAVIQKKSPAPILHKPGAAAIVKPQAISLGELTTRCTARSAETR